MTAAVEAGGAGSASTVHAARMQDFIQKPAKSPVTAAMCAATLSIGHFIRIEKSRLERQNICSAFNVEK
jgi:hypothetical protein